MSSRKAALAAAAGTAAVVTLLGIAATPAFAKSDSTLTGPRTAQAGHPFRLTVAVGDDGGARPARARLQVRDTHGHFRWLGAWHQLHRTSYPGESWAFTVTARHRGPETFRAVITGYATTDPVTVAVRLPAASVIVSDLRRTCKV
jgi:hypothetical protein